MEVYSRAVPTPRSQSSPRGHDPAPRSTSASPPCCTHPLPLRTAHEPSPAWRFCTLRFYAAHPAPPPSSTHIPLQFGRRCTPRASTILPTAATLATHSMHTALLDDWHGFSFQWLMAATSQLSSSPPPAHSNRCSTRGLAASVRACWLPLAQPFCSHRLGFLLDLASHLRFPLACISHHPPSLHSGSMPRLADTGSGRDIDWNISTHQTPPGPAPFGPTTLALGPSAT